MTKDFTMNFRDILQSAENLATVKNEDFWM